MICYNTSWNCLQVVFYVKPALECASASGHNVQEVRDVRIPNTETFIRPAAFTGCGSLLRLVIPESVTQIGPSAFQNCSSLTSLTIPGSVTQIGHTAFAGCSLLTSLTIPQSVSQIGHHAFAGCSSLTSLTIPESITEIGEFAFADYRSLSSLNIPKSMSTRIMKRTFDGCSSLTNLTHPNAVRGAKPSKRCRRWKCCSWWDGIGQLAMRVRPEDASTPVAEPQFEHVWYYTLW